MEYLLLRWLTNETFPLRTGVAAVPGETAH
jgi:hypothetical protein